MVQLPHHFDAPLDGRFLVEHQVGSGAAGAVYRAVDLRHGRVVALKVLDPDGSAETLGSAEREAELLGSIDHPGIVKVWEAGYLETLGAPYLSMEWLDGRSLRERQQTTPLTVRQIVFLGALVARALDHAHTRGIVHRDIKPDNILLRGTVNRESLAAGLDGEPVLVDFGIAARSSARGWGGTPAYMSPEQARAEAQIDARSDLYSLGATLFELLVGRPPHQGTSPIATLARLATTPAPRLSFFRPELSKRLDEVLDRLLRTHPERRTPSAAVAHEELLECLEDEAPASFPEAEASSRLGTSATRLLTTLVAVGFTAEEQRDQAVAKLESRGADTAALGASAVVAHLGVHRATGGEAQAALELGQRLAASGVSVGIASGRARLHQVGGDSAVYPVGEVVDRAASLAHEAKPEQVLADATTSELGRGRWEFRVRDDGSAVVGDAVRGGGLERGGGAPFVGRETELSQILAAYERARADGRSLVVSVTGAPGIGKSRLQREALARLSSRADPPRVVVQRRDAYGQRHVLGAAADVLRALVELRKGASPLEAEQAIEEALGPQTWSDKARAQRHLLTRLLANEPLPDGLSPVGARDALWLAMTDLVLHVLGGEPLVLVMEDLQWADSESIGWLDHLLGRANGHPLFLLACVRPHFWTDGEGRFSLRDHVRLDLRPISKQAVRQIASAVLGGGASAASIDRIAERAGGSPLFAEELARLSTLGKDDTLAPTIEAAIQASLDALDAECRDAVGRLSVLGLATWDEALEALGLPDADRLLKELCAREILVAQDTSRFPNVKEFLFKHALVRDVAYQTLDQLHLAELHLLAGGWLARMGEDAATVAGHFDLGGDSFSAAEHWERAAVRALAANALRDALTMAERALVFADSTESAFRRAGYLDEAWSRLDPRAADRESAVSALEESVYDEGSRVLAEGARARYDDARGVGSDVSERLAAVLEAATRLGRSDEVARCSATLAKRAAFRGDFVTAEAEAKRLLDLSVHQGHAARVDAYQTLAIIRQAKGSVYSALEARRSAVEAARESGSKEREALLTTNLGFALSSVGARAEARDALTSGLFLAEAIGSVGAIRHAQMNLLGWCSLYGGDRRLDPHLTEARAEADEVASSRWAAPDRSNLGLLFYRGAELLRTGSESTLKRALALLKMSVESYRQLEHWDVLPVALGTWAEGERVSGRAEEARRIAQEAATLLESGAPSLLNEAPVYLALFKSCLDVGDDEGARKALAQSVRPLVRRLNGLAGSPYTRSFLTELPQNAELVAALDAASLLPESIYRVLASGREG